MKDLNEKIKIVEEDFDKFRTFVRFWNLRNAYIVNGKLEEVEGKLFDKNGKLIFDKVISFDYVNDYINDFEKNDPNLFRVYNNMRKTYLKKRKRVFDRNKFLLDNYKYACFITLTFNDKYINMSYRCRRNHINKYLNQFNCFICNIDYGDTDEYIDSKGNKRLGTHREHYHCLIGFNNPNISYRVNKWICGFYYVEEVNRDEDDQVRLSKYLVKLTHHNLKLSTKSNNLIYSKNLKEI